MRAAVPAHIPVTVKTRLGYEDRALFLDIVAGIEAAGATELTIHARTKRHGYRPPAYWDAIAEARELLALPIIANGEIWSIDDALRCRAVTGCDDLMLGRGVLCRPDLPRLIAAATASGDSRGVAALGMRLRHCWRNFFELNLQHYDTHNAGNPLKQWLVYLRGYFPQAALLFEQIKRLRNPDDIRLVLQQSHCTSRIVCDRCAA